MGAAKQTVPHSDVLFCPLGSENVKKLWLKKTKFILNILLRCHMDEQRFDTHVKPNQRQAGKEKST
jgi:hypothetical protein